MLPISFVMAVTLSAAQPVSVASLGIQAPAAHRELANSLDNTLALRMRETGLVKVTTAADVAAVLGRERQQQLLGCSETSCMAELAGALDARALVTGELVRIGELFQISVRVIDSANASAIFAALERHADAQSLLTAVDRLAEAAATAVGRHYRWIVKKTNSLPLVGMIAGGAVAVGGGVLLALSAADRDALVAKKPATFAAAETLKREGELKQTLGLVLVSVGAAAAIGSLVWQLSAGEVDTRVAVSASPGGVVVWGQF